MPRRVSEMSEDGQAAIGEFATANGAAKDDLTNVSEAAILSALSRSGAVDAIKTAVLELLTGSAPPLVAGSAPPSTATVGVAFAYTLTASGGTAPYSWSASGALAAGLSLVTSGAISGTPTGAQTAAVTLTVTDAAGATATVPWSLTVAAATDGYVTLFYDAGNRPLSYREGSSTTFNGVTHGPFAQRSMEEGRGNYTGYEWTDGQEDNDPYNTEQFWTRRDDQTVVLNPLSATVYETGYVGAVRDCAAGTTTLRVKRRSGTNASGLSISTGEARADGSLLGAMLNMQHSLSGPPPYRMTVTGCYEPTTVAEAWIAFLWTRQADSKQSTTNPLLRIDGPNGGHNEIDAWEHTGLSSTLNKVYTNQLYNAATGTDTSLKSNVGTYADLGEARAGTEWDVRLTVTTAGWTVEIKKSSVSTWTEYRSSTHPVDGRFGTCPVFLQIDAKAGFRWADAPTWVESIDGSTPDFSVRFKTLKVEVPTANAANWTNRTIDPATIPAATVTWTVTTSAIDNSVADATVLANLTANSGYTYAVKGCSGMTVSGNQIVKSGSIPAGSREVAVWMIRTSDGARFLVGVTEITVLDNAQWWDDDAKVSINFESQQVREFGVAGDYSDYIVDGQPTATLRNMLPGYATTGVAVWQGTGGAASFQGLWGYTEAANRGRFAVQFLGATLSCGIKDGAGVDKTATIAGLSNASGSWKIGVSFDDSGVKVCGNGGTVNSSATGYLAASGTECFLWQDGYASNGFAGTKQRLFLYDPDDIGGATGALVSDAILQGKTT